MSRKSVYPPLIRTSDPDSFADFTVGQRLPAIVDQIIRKNTLAGDEAVDLRRLQRRLRSGTVEPLLSTHPYLADHLEADALAVWNREIEAHAGKPWTDLPWYFAESLFYLEILLAWGYYRRQSPRYATDPFRPFKTEELERPGGALDLAFRIAEQTCSIHAAEEQLTALLRYGLWANRLDLSYSSLHERYKHGSGDEANQLLLDHSQEAAEKLLRADRVDLILDNSASELIADLLLVHALLQRSPGLNVVLHCKQAPYYVSDATVDDVAATIRRLKQNPAAELRSLGRKLDLLVERGSLIPTDHYFWNGPLHFSEFPHELRRELGRSDLAVLKGDLNYRRLLGDRRWNPATAMEQIVGYFPSAFVTLRTTKSELIVDIPGRTVERLNRDDPNWLIEGRYGIIRYCDPPLSRGARSSITPLSR